MKKLVINLFVICLLISCKKDEIIDQDNLVGTWKKDYVIGDDEWYHAHAQMGGPYTLLLNQNRTGSDYNLRGIHPNLTDSIIFLTWNFNETDRILTLNFKDTTNNQYIDVGTAIYKVYELTKKKMICKPLFNNFYLYNVIDDIYFLSKATP